MTLISERPPSPAMVVALCALFVALTGTTFAAIRVDSGDIDNNTIVSKDLKNKKAVKSPDVMDGSLMGTDVTDGSLHTADLADGAVNSSKVANDSLTGEDVDESSLGTVPNATNATSATTADTATTPGFAFVAADGSFSRSKGVASVSHPGTGIYCFDLTFTPLVAVGSPAFPDVRVVLPSIPPVSSCPSGLFDASIAVADTSTGAPQNNAFWVVFE